jgi:hypothetical protein
MGCTVEPGSDTCVGSELPEGDQQLVAAGLAAHPREAIREDAVPEVALEFARDEPADSRPPLRPPPFREEGLPVRADRRVQQRPLRQ